jgi:hypothetical protein
MRRSLDMVSRSRTAIRTRKTAASFHKTRAVVVSIREGQQLRAGLRGVGGVVGLVSSRGFASTDPILTTSPETRSTPKQQISGNLRE